MSIEEAPAWIRRLEKEFVPAAERGLVAAAERLVQHIVTEIIPKEPRIPVDKGIFRAGWRVRKIPRGAIVYNAAPHATFINDGVRGENVKIGRAMIDALAKWVVRKGLTGPAKGAERAAEGQRIAWAIAKSMKAKGIFAGGKGLKILERALEKAPTFMTEEVKRELEKIG